MQVDGISKENSEWGADQARKERAWTEGKFRDMEDCAKKAGMIC